MTAAAKPALERPYYLQIGRSTLYRKIHDYEIRPEEYIGGSHDDHRG